MYFQKSNNMENGKCSSHNNQAKYHQLNRQRRHKYAGVIQQEPQDICVCHFGKWELYR